MNRYLYILLKLRDFMMSNFWVDIKGIIRNNQIIYISGIYNLIKIFPLFILKLLSCFNINIIYKIDDIYCLTLNKKNHIIPAIFKFNVIDKNGNTHNLLNKLKYYNTSLPLLFLLDNNNIEGNEIELKYIHNNKLVNKSLTIKNDIIIYNLFDN
jgi:hypothetical protein